MILADQPTPETSRPPVALAEREADRESPRERARERMHSELSAMVKTLRGGE